MSTIAFTPNPLAFAENSVLSVLRSATVKGDSSWVFPASNRAALERLASRGLVTMKLEGKGYRVALTPEGKADLGI